MTNFKKGKVLSLKANNVVNVLKSSLFRFLSRKPKVNPQKEPEKESIFAFLKGSMSLEASLVVPIFLLFLMTILMSIEMVRLQTKEFEALHQKFEQQYESDIGIIKETTNEHYDSFTSFIPIGNIDIEDTVFGHSFSGFSNDDGLTKEGILDEYVYVTITGKRYHRDIDCSYIKIIPSSIEAKSVGGLRNPSGGKYYPCERCHPKREGILFYTQDGDRYHSTTGCSSLRRTVNIMKLSEAEDNGYTPCSKCS